MTGMTDPQACPAGRHCDRDECQSQDLDRVGNVVPDESQQTDPGRQDEHRCGTGEQIASEVALLHCPLGPAGDRLGLSAVCLNELARSHLTGPLHMWGAVRRGCMLHWSRTRLGREGSRGIHGGGGLIELGSGHLRLGGSGGVRGRGLRGVGVLVRREGLIDRGLNGGLVETLPGVLRGEPRLRGNRGRSRFRM